MPRPTGKVQCIVAGRDGRFVVPAGTDAALDRSLAIYRKLSGDAAARQRAGVSDMGPQAAAIAAKISVLACGKLAAAEYGQTWDWEDLTTGVVAYRLDGQKLQGVAPTTPASTGVEVFTQQGCPYCSQAKDWLRRKGVSFTERDIADPRNDAALQKLTGPDGGVPVIVRGTAVIEGFDEPLLSRTFGSTQ